MRFTQNDVYDILTDIQRVENMCQTLKTRIHNQLCVNVNITIKTDWNRNDIPTIEQMERIRGNVETIAQVLDPNYSITTFDNKFNYSNANDLEIALDYTLDYLNELVRIISQPQANFYFANEPLVLMATR